MWTLLKNWFKNRKADASMKQWRTMRYNFRASLTYWIGGKNHG